MDSDQHGGKAAEVKDDKQSAGVEDSSKLNKTERCEKAITECRKDFEKLKKRETTEKAMTESGSGSMVPMNVMDSVMRENKLLRQQLKALLNKCGRTMEEYLVSITFLTHCGLEMLYGDINLSQHWVR